MTTGEREQFSTALGLSAGANVALFLGIAWSMAVHRGFFSASRNALMEQIPAVEELVITVESVPPSPAPDMALPQPAPVPPPAGEADDLRQKLKKHYVSAPDSAPEEDPANSGTNLLSSRNLRAASRTEGTEDGGDGLPTLRLGRDLPQLALQDTDFIPGDSASKAPPTPVRPSSTAEATAGPPSPEKTRTSETSSDTPPESVPLAFRDGLASATAPAGSTAAPAGKTAAPPPAPASAGLPLPSLSSSAGAGGVQIQQRAARVNGKTKTKGTDSIDAVKAPGAAYRQLVETTLTSIYKPREAQLKDFITRGSVDVAFEVDMLGQISNVRLINPGEANAIMQDLAITTVMKARLQPPPMELFQNREMVVNGNRLRWTFTFLYY